MQEPVSAVLIGAGQRGSDVYGRYALQHPDQLRFVAVAEPDAPRRSRFADRHDLDQTQEFAAWQDLLAGPQRAHVAFVCTQDQQHTEPALAAMRAGYDVLLEKPMATTAEECALLVHTSETLGRQLHISHVMRYTRHYSLMRDILQSGRLGQVVTVDHRENVSFYHMAHSFVRGNWRNKALSSPMILAKCCHDLDLLVWLLDGHCETLSSVGGLMHYRPENAPPGAPLRCTDGCPAAESCPFYAPFIYMDMEPVRRSLADPDGFVPADYRGWPVSVLALDPTPANVLHALQTGPYGRCVYHCDNDVVDHQVVSMHFSGGQSVTLTMHGHSQVEGRSTRIEGSLAELHSFSGSGQNWIEIHEHRSGCVERIDTTPPAGAGHGGGDEGLAAAFVESIRSGGKTGARTTARQALESHLMAFAAEEARLNGNCIVMDRFAVEAEANH